MAKRKKARSCEEEVALAKRRETLLQAAARVSRNVASILDPDQLLEQTVDIICDEFGFYYAGVFLIDETGEWAVLRAGRGEPGRKMVEAGHKLKVDGHSMIGRATGERRALIALDVGEEPVHFKNPYLPNTHSEMALPLIVGNELIGALTVQSEEVAAFTEDDIVVLQGMADQLAIAIKNARLHQENRRLLARAQRRARLLEAAAQVGRDATSILDLDELMNKVVDIICDAYGFYYAGVFLVDESGEWAVLRAGRGEAGRKMIEAGHKLKVGGLSMIGTAIAQRKARIALDVGEEPVHFKNPYLPYTRSEMALPLVVGDQVIGAITVQSMEEAAFSDEDIASLQAMADQVAVAIRNAQLLKDLEEAHKELVRTKTFEAIATSTLEAIHWIGNKALPITASVEGLREDLSAFREVDAERVESMMEDLEIIDESAHLIFQVREHIIGPAREVKPGALMAEDVLRDAAIALGMDEMIHYEVAEALPRVLADPLHLSRAFTYVLKNALEAVEGMDSPHIGVEIVPAGDFVAVRITDNGPAIPEEVLDKIWAPFFTTKGRRHAGLGLSATMQIIRQMEGKAKVENLPEGGVMVELLLPLYDGHEPEVEMAEGLKVLLLDDDDPWSRFAIETWEEAENEVKRATVLEKPERYDLIIIDDVMAEGDSVQLLRDLRRSGAAKKTVVVASRLGPEEATRLLQYGAKDVRPKPYSEAGLAELLDEAEPSIV